MPRGKFDCVFGSACRVFASPHIFAFKSADKKDPDELILSRSRDGVVIAGARCAWASTAMLTSERVRMFAELSTEPAGARR